MAPDIDDTDETYYIWNLSKGKSSINLENGIIKQNVLKFDSQEFF